MPHRMLSLEEAAEYLHIPVPQIVEMSRQGEIPHAKRGDRLVFGREALDAWISQRILKMSAGGIRDYHKHTSRRMFDRAQTDALIPDLVLPDFIHPRLSSKTRAAAVRDLAALAEKTGRVVYPVDLRNAIEAREKLGTTALPGGLAIPHPVRPDPYLFESSFVIVARSENPIPFGSPDGELTDLFFLMCCGDEHLHVHLLARLCMMCHHTSLLLRLRETRDPEVMLNALLAAESEVLPSAVAH